MDGLRFAPVSWTTPVSVNTPLTLPQELTAMTEQPASSNQLGNWLLARFPGDFINALPDWRSRFPRPADQQRPEPVPVPNQPEVSTVQLPNGVTVSATNNKAVQRLETLLSRMAHRIGHPIIDNIRVVIDDTMGDIGPRNGTGNQAAYQNTRDAASGKIFQESLHINTQFLEYLSRQPISKAEAYLAAVLFHEQSHRDVLKAAEQQGQFHRISQSDEKNANERAEAGIAQFYPEYYSWLRQNYFGLFREHFTEAYGALPSACEADLAVIHAGNLLYNRRFFASKPA